MAKFVFLMQHKPTNEQVLAAKASGAESIVALAPAKPEDKIDGIEYVGSVTLLNVPDNPILGRNWFVQRSTELLDAAGVEAKDTVHVMGQQQLVNAVNALARNGGCYRVESITAREAIEEPQPDGSTKKVAMFRFKGFRPVYDF